MPDARGRDTLPPPLASMLAPLHRSALGAAVGIVCGLGLLLLTLVDVLRGPVPQPGLALLAQYFPGYSVSLGGALAGFAWAAAVGFCAGWLLALVRNFVIGWWIFLTRSRHELGATRDFLDRV